MLVLDSSNLVTKSVLNATVAKAIKHDTMLKNHESSIKIQGESLLVLEKALMDISKDHGTMLKNHESAITLQGESLVILEKALMDSSGNVEKLGGKVGTVEDDLNRLMASLKDLEVHIIFRPSV